MSSALQVRRKDWMVHWGVADVIIDNEDAEAGAAREGTAATVVRRIKGSCIVTVEGLLVWYLG